MAHVKSTIRTFLSVSKWLMTSIRSQMEDVIIMTNTTLQFANSMVATVVSYY